ncbi:hypothetical protein [Leptospira borgpetersenii]|uniref:Uncharacterized protein n=3 Tax=Leptospira TaxID=171 RepID=A0ABP2S4L0_LEPBO|nr:hypothetical protein [Leptospira borgpetersenii]EKP14121.1 hypothetical protein LEP1GSC128_2920 [Leptospira borgpetersenii str. 200801926]ENO63478.1 hypothetical protein LEP1GSC191_2010 [Leptospira borgpetersenii serovar Mini str. 201000851]
MVVAGKLSATTPMVVAAGLGLYTLRTCSKTLKEISTIILSVPNREWKFPQISDLWLF